MKQQGDNGLSYKQGFNLLYTLCILHQRALTVVSRRRFGVQALRLPCLLALVLMVLWAGFTNDNLLWLWTGLWFVCFLRRRVEAVRLVRGGVRVHSWYDGFPADVCRYVRSEKVAKRIVEPALVGLLGGILWWIYGEQGWGTAGLPTFLLTGLFTLPFVELVKRAAWEKRTQAAVDARLEAEALVRDVRDRYGDL